MKRPIPFEIQNCLLPLDVGYPHPPIFGCGGQQGTSEIMDRPLQKMNYLYSRFPDNKVSPEITRRQAVIIHDFDLSINRHILLTYGDEDGVEYTNDPEVKEILKEMEAICDL